MSIRATCDCGATVKAKSELAGKRVKCPTCGEALTVPDPRASVSTKPVTCQCGQTFQAKPELWGKNVKCPKCGATISIPTSDAGGDAEDPLGLGDLSSFENTSQQLPGAGTLPVATPLGSLPSAAAPPKPAAKQQSSGKLSGKKIAILAVGGGALLLLGVLTVVVIVRRPATDWSTYTSTSGGYKVDMPGRVRTKPYSHPFDGGSVPAETANASVNDNNRVQIIVLHYGPERWKKALAIGVSPDAATSAEVKADPKLSRRSLTFASRPAFEVSGQKVLGGKVVFVREITFDANDKIYVLHVGSRDGTPSDADCEKFFDSFSLLGGGQAEPSEIAKRQKQTGSTDAEESAENAATAKTPDAATVAKAMTPEQLELGGPITNGIGMVLVPVPAGEFHMGSSDSDLSVFPPDLKNVRFLVKGKPRHLVRITKPFYLSAYEVTQQQYEKVMGVRRWQGERFVKFGPDYPASTITWDDAVAFCRKLSEQEGVEYRLPTESEWEYACRAGTTTVFSFGDDASQLEQYGWHTLDSDKHAHQVGRRMPNSWGLYDMHGNVAEWCQDWYGPYGSEEALDNPKGPANGVTRLLRGGAYFSQPYEMRSATRINSLLTPTTLIGFRPLRTNN